ncbi:MAG: hypothetical protein ACFFB0_17405 [Promethearchaeota archaeon]
MKKITTEENLICVLLYGETETEEQIIEIARGYENCPYIRLMSTKGNQLYAMFFLPVRQKWWIEYIEKNPGGTFGLRNAKITFLDKVYYPKKLTLKIPEKLNSVSPCGAYCKECQSLDKCSGCPATIYYKKN